MAYGNASLEIIASAFAPMLLGADPLAQRVLQDRLFHQHIKLGPDGAYAGAVAAVDIALWDLKGKLLGQPIYQLLGGGLADGAAVLCLDWQQWRAECGRGLSRCRGVDAPGTSAGENPFRC